MSIAADILSVILLLGSVQGFIMIALARFTSPRRLQTRFFTWLVMLISLACVNLYLAGASWVQSDRLLRLLPDVIPLMIVMPVGPLLYFYVRAVLEPGFRFTRRYEWHFSTAIIDLVPYLAAWIFIIGVLTRRLPANPGPWGLFMDNWNRYGDIPRWMSVSIYVLLTRRYLETRKPEELFKIQEWQWLKEFINVFLVFQCIHFIYLVPYIISPLQPAWWDNIGWYPVYLPLVVMIYWLGLKGYLFSLKEKQMVSKTVSLSPDMVQQTITNLKKAMEEEHLYLNPELNLSMLVQHLNIPQKTISAVLNQHLHKSFNEFVNSYRIEAFKRQVLQADLSHLTITGIAMECGFNSQATFQRIFKQYTGMTPSEYRKQPQ